MATVSRAVLRACAAWTIIGTWTVASAGPWANPSGTGTNFTYSNGHDLAGRFGEPTVSDGTFTFPLITFGVSSSGGGDTSLRDIVSFDLQVDPGWQFAHIQVFALGGYAVSGDPALNSANADLTLSVAENGANPRQWLGDWVTTPEMPVNAGSGGWYGLAPIDLSSASPPPVESIHVELTSYLRVVSAIGGTALINIDTGNGLMITVDTIALPEPAALTLLSVAGYLGLRRRR